MGNLKYGYGFHTRTRQWDYAVLRFQIAYVSLLGKTFLISACQPGIRTLNAGTCEEKRSVGKLLFHGNVALHEQLLHATSKLGTQYTS